MSVVAPTQDLLIRIKNAYMARKTIVDFVVHSNFLESMVVLLKKYKFVREYTVVEDGNKKFLTIYLHEVVNPVQDIPVVRLFSKPSRRWYIGYKDIKPVAGGKGIGIISTNK
jgi:small subunit ribosomal protein S8